MAFYSLYIMDGLGNVGRVKHLVADDDEEAVHFACQQKLYVTSEVWDRARLVAQIPPHDASA